MRKFLSLLLALVMVLCCIPAVAETADGVYEGTGAGLNGQIKVSVTVSGGKITEVKVLEHSETAGISDPAIEKIPAAIVEAQSADVDIVSGATFTSKGIIEAVKNALNPDAAEEAGMPFEQPDILVIGAGDGGVVRELTRYDRVESIDLVEMDPQVIEACRAYLPGNACRMDDRRVHIYYENALKFIRKCEDEYDLIIVDSSDPFGPSEGLFTREFYGNCYNALRDDGIMVNQQGSPFYAEDATAMQRSHKRIASTFPISKVYQAHIPTFAAGYWLFGFASKKYHPINDMDSDAWNALNMRTRYYTTRLHVGAFYLPAFLEEMLREVEDC